MPVNADFTLNSLEDGSLTVGLIPAANVSGWSNVSPTRPLHNSFYRPERYPVLSRKYVLVAPLPWDVLHPNRKNFILSQPRVSVHATSHYQATPLATRCSTVGITVLHVFLRRAPDQVAEPVVPGLTVQMSALVPSGRFRSAERKQHQRMNCLCNLLPVSTKNHMIVSSIITWNHPTPLLTEPLRSPNLSSPHGPICTNPVAEIAQKCKRFVTGMEAGIIAKHDLRFSHNQGCVGLRGRLNYPSFLL